MFAGTENVQAAQKFITGLDARRIAKLPEHRWSVFNYSRSVASICRLFASIVLCQICLLLYGLM